MSLNRIFAFSLVATVVTLSSGFPAAAESPVLRYACSNQVYKAFSEEQAKAFREESGISVEVMRGSSSASVSEVLNGRMDVASTAQELRPDEEAQGLREFPFCVSPIALIARAGCGIASVAKDQVPALFTDGIANWRDLGGPDLPVTVVVPSDETAAHHNFRKLVIGWRTIQHDYLAKESTGVIELVRNLPCGAVSFISYGAVTGNAEITALAVGNLRPAELGYPYAQTFRLVTKGEPTGPLQAFVDFSYSQTSRSIIERHGMVPLGKR
jgi:ABC-type phosphate transport system substrate-binding protein